MEIEANRQLVAGVPLTAQMLDSLRRTVRLLSTHYSTQIGGNRLSLVEVQAVIAGEGNFPGREDDDAEVKHYCQSPKLRELSPQQRQALGLFLRFKQVSARDMATFFKTSPRKANALCAKWVEDGFLVPTDPSKKRRRYGLAIKYESLVARQAEEN